MARVARPGARASAKSTGHIAPLQNARRASATGVSRFVRLRTERHRWRICASTDPKEGRHGEPTNSVSGSRPKVNHFSRHRDRVFGIRGALLATDTPAAPDRADGETTGCSGLPTVARSGNRGPVDNARLQHVSSSSV